MSIITLLNPKQEKLASWVSLINQTLASLIPSTLGSIPISIEIARSLNAQPDFSASVKYLFSATIFSNSALFVFEIFKLLNTGPTIGVGVGVGVGVGLGVGVGIGVGLGVGVGVGVGETEVAVGFVATGVEVVSGLGVGVAVGAFVGVGTATVSVFDAVSVVVTTELLVELIIEFEVVVSSF